MANGIPKSPYFDDALTAFGVGARRSISGSAP